MVRSLLPDGPRFVIEASETHLRSVRRWTSLLPVALVIVGHSQGRPRDSDQRDLIHYERRILGSEYFDNRGWPKSGTPSVGTLAPEGIITHRLPLEKISEAYRLFWSGETGKVLVYPNGIPRG
jgi:Zn-dependent alcohol dehydrogenase